MFSTILDALQGLVAAIETISVSATSAARANASGCGCPGGTDGPSTEGVEGDPPPDGGWENTGDTVGSAGYQSRKCTVANIVHQWVKQVTGKLTQANVDAIISAFLAGGFALAGAYIVTILTGLVFGWVLLVIGFVVAVVKVFVDESVDLSDLATLLSTYDEEFVCALYSAQSSGEAKTNYLAAASSAGATTGQLAYLSALFTVDDILNTLFFTPIMARGAELDAAIADWSGGVQCSSACAQAWWDCSYGTVTDITETTVTIDAVAAGGDYLAHIGLDTADNLSTSQTGWTTPSTVPSFATAWDTSVNRCGAGAGDPWSFTSSSFVSPAGALVHGALYRSGTPFTVVFTRS